MQAQIATASAALKRFQRVGAVAAVVPTPERLLRDRGHAHVERSLSFVDVANAAGELSPVCVKGHRIRISSGPFEQMASRRALDPKDEARGRALASAGRRYLSLWRTAGLEPLKGQDPGKIRGTTTPEGLLVGPERMSHAWALYRSASAVLDRDERFAVDAIVLRELPLEMVGRYMSHRKSDKQAIAVAVHELQSGLEKLAIHFGLLLPTEPDPIEDVMARLLADMDRQEAARS